jgi:hypothetical protein
VQAATRLQSLCFDAWFQAVARRNLNALPIAGVHIRFCYSYCYLLAVISADDKHYGDGSQHPADCSVYGILVSPTTLLPSLYDGSSAAANQLVCNPGFVFFSFLHYSVTRGLKRGCAAGWIRGSPLNPG